MDPFSVIVLALIYAALKAPGEAGRAVRNDYRGRRDRWSSTWQGRSRGRGVAGYDRAGRGYSRDQRSGRRRGDPGWWRDPAAWRGREGRARVARGVRPSAIRAGIVTGALAYSALFGAGVAARGFARGLRGGYRLGRIHYREKLARREGGATFTVTPGSPGDIGAEVVDGVIVSDLEDTPSTASNGGAGAGPVVSGWIDVPDEFVNDDPDGDDIVTVVHGPDSGERPAWLPAAWQITVRDADGRALETLIVTDPAELRRRTAEIGASPYRWAQVDELARIPQTVDRAAAGWVITVFDTGEDEYFDRFTSTDPDHVDQFLREIAATGRLRAEITPLPDTEDSRPQSAAGPTYTPGETPVSDIATRSTAPSPAATVTRGDGLTAVRVAFDSSLINAPMLMEGANYGAHLHNLGVIGKEARAEYASAELSLASASAARQRAEHAMAAVEQMAVGLAAQDFGETHVANMTTLHELLARHVAQARAAEQAAAESLATSEQLIEMCVNAATVFQRDHGQLAEAHAAAPHAAKTREAYQPM